MQRQEVASRRAHVRVQHLFIISFFLGYGLLAHAALPPVVAEALPTTEAVEAPFELNRERWQRFLQASRARYQALAEKAQMLEWPLQDACADTQLPLAERRECLRADVFARAAMEQDGMVLEEYAQVLHVAVSVGPGANAHQRGQFRRLQQEWWPDRRTAEQ